MTLQILSIGVLLLIVWLVVFLIRCAYFLPTLPDNNDVAMLERRVVDDNYFTCDNSWLLQNEEGLWEMYIEGAPLYRGSVSGALSKDLMAVQEDVFVRQIYDMVPSESLIKFLRVFIGIYNRNLGDYIPEEYKEEIYAISKYTQPEFDTIGRPYQRMMNYHAAHDIGHAVQVMGFVGCSTFGVWDSRSEDGSLLMGRNFDFYVGDDFAKNKMILFVNPDNGYKHAFITWSSMMGVVSGMNEHGLAIELNAAPTSIPYTSGTPVSIVAREVLQYARNIEEAVAIIRSKKTFVSELFTIASAEDKKIVCVEKKPRSLEVYESEKDYFICTNHFQSPAYYDESAVSQTSSGYRYRRIEEWAAKEEVFNPTKMLQLLRDKQGLNNANIGLGNEKSINQLLAHHGVIFQPETRTMWVSTSPCQMGKMMAYNLDSVFAATEKPGPKGVSIEQWNMAADTATINHEWKDYVAYKQQLEEGLTAKERLIELNPDYYYTYKHIGDLYLKEKQYTTAVDYYHQALEKEIPNEKQRTEIVKLIEKCTKKDTP